MKAENGRFRVKTAPNAALSPLLLKTPEMEAANRVKAIGGNPGILSGSISLPLAGLNASDTQINISDGRQKSQKPTVVSISTGFLTVLTLLTGPSHQKGVHQNEPVRTLGPLGFYGCIAIMSSNDV